MKRSASAPLPQLEPVSPPSLPQLAGTLAGAALKGGLLVGLMYLLYVALWGRPTIFAWFWKLFE